jgi:hypothetical protein
VGGIIANEVYRWAQHSSAANAARSKEALAAKATRKEADSVQALKNANMERQKLDERLLAMEAQKKLEFEAKEREMAALRERQAEERNQAKAALAVVEAQAAELQRKFAALHDLAERYSQLVAGVDKVDKLCTSMIHSLKSFGVMQEEVVGAADFAEGDQAELMKELVPTFTLDKIEEQIRAIEELQGFNDDLMRRAKQIFNDYHGLTVEEGQECWVTGDKP